MRDKKDFIEFMSILMAGGCVVCTIASVIEYHAITWNSFLFASFGVMFAIVARIALGE